VEPIEGQVELPAQHEMCCGDARGGVQCGPVVQQSEMESGENILMKTFNAAFDLGVIICSAYVMDALAFKVRRELCRDQLRTIVGGDGLWEASSGEEKEVDNHLRGHRVSSGELWPFGV